MSTLIRKIPKLSNFFIEWRKKMNQRKIIRKIAGPALEKEGFVYSKEMSGPGYTAFYNFEKKHEISFQKSNYANLLRINLVSSINKPWCFLGQGKLDERYSKTFWLEYSNEEEFAQVVNELLKVVLEKGLSALDYIDSTEMVKSDHDMYLSLSKDTAGKAEKFAMEYGLSLLYKEENYQTLKQLIDTLKAEDNTAEGFYKNQDFFLCAAAYVGETIRSDFVCDWVWGSDSQHEPIKYALYCHRSHVPSDNFHLDSLLILISYWNLYPVLYDEDLIYKFYKYNKSLDVIRRKKSL